MLGGESLRLLAFDGWEAHLAVMAGAGICIVMFDRWIVIPSNLLTILGYGVVGWLGGFVSVSLLELILIVVERIKGRRSDTHSV
jgi:hypothetical protein